MADWVFQTRGPLDPVKHAAVFVERPEGDEIIHLARQAHVSNYVALLSSRQTGKTTLLYQVRRRLQERHYAVAFVDLSVLGDQDEPACYQYVSSQIEAELHPYRPYGEPLTATPVRSSLEFRSFLLKLARQTPVTRIVIMLDEVGAIPSDVSDVFFSTIRNVFSSRNKESEGDFQKYLFIFSGATDLHTLTTGENSPLNICEKVYLQDFDREGVRKLVDNFPRLGATVQRGVVTYLHELTGGHPYLTQRVCSIMERQGVKQVDAGAVDQAVEFMLQGDDNLTHVIRQLEREPEARYLLQQIVMEGQKVYFSRLNPLVAQLEMIGAVKGGPFCQVRNPIYERALRRYFQFVASTSSSAISEEKRLALLRDQLRVLQINLARLELREAQYGLDVPTALANEIEMTRENIARVEREIALLEGR